MKIKSSNVLNIQKGNTFLNSGLNNESGDKENPDGSNKSLKSSDKVLNFKEMLMQKSKIEFRKKAM